MTASYLKLQLIKCNFQSPGFEDKLLELAVHGSSTNLAFNRSVLSGWVHLGCVVIFAWFPGLLSEILVSNLSSPERFLIERSLKMCITTVSSANQIIPKICLYPTCAQHSVHTLCTDMLRQINGRCPVCKIVLGLRDYLNHRRQALCPCQHSGWVLADHISMRLDGEESTPRREIKVVSL